jgi:predicted DCC family thiol-disulfide oxidoreductase YuxK
LLLFFDGQCAFCNRWVDRIREADHAQLMRFGTKQGMTYQQVARDHPELANVDSVVLVKRRADGTEGFLVRSAAIRELIQELPQFRFLGTVLLVCPTALADLGYRLFAKVRTPLFGRLAQCRVPSGSEKHLFLE